MNSPTRIAFLTFTATCACTASGQSTIDPANALSWSENAGWMNWTDAGDGAESVRLEPTFLFGFVWCENTGYINLGDGSPDNAVAYANLTGLDWGVNVAANSNLSGFGWGENIGWINFGTARSLGGLGLQARLDASAQCFRGYAWGENVGWINLDDSSHFVGTLPASCPADFNQDGGVDGADVSAFFDEWETGQSNADVNHDGGVDGSDVSAFFDAWEAGGC